MQQTGIYAVATEPMSASFSAGASMSKTLLILNDGPYGTERSYDALRLAGLLSKDADNEVKVFLIGDAAACAKGGQKVPEGLYNIELMLHRIVRQKGEVGYARLAWTREESRRPSW